MHPTAVIFDFDGVIVDSLRSHLDAWNRALKLHFDQSLTPELSQQIMGHSTAAIGEILATHFNAPTLAKDLAATKRKVLVKNGRDIKLLGGAREAFLLLAKLKVPFGVASNAPRAYIERLLRTHEMQAKVVMGIEDVIHPKPSPEAYLVCARRLGIAPSHHANTLVFEDSVHGLQAGIKAGMFTIGVTTEHSSSVLLQAGARQTCANLAEAIANDWFENAPF